MLLTTFALTVFTDLRLAVGVGMVLASMLFMKRMADVSNISAITREFDDGDEELGDLKDPNSTASRDVPAGVEVYEINGPFFFGVADRLKDVLHNLERAPKVFILRMRRVPSIDASGMHALEEFHDKCKRDGTLLLLSGVHAQPLFAFTRSGFIDVIGSKTCSATSTTHSTAPGNSLACRRKCVRRRPCPKSPAEQPSARQTKSA